MKVFNVYKFRIFFKSVLNYVKSPRAKRLQVPIINVI